MANQIFCPIARSRELQCHILAWIRYKQRCEPYDVPYSVRIYHGNCIYTNTKRTEHVDDRLCSDPILPNAPIRTVKRKLREIGKRRQEDKRNIAFRSAATTMGEPINFLSIT